MNGCMLNVNEIVAWQRQTETAKIIIMRQLLHVYLLLGGLCSTIIESSTQVNITNYYIIIGILTFNLYSSRPDLTTVNVYYQSLCPHSLQFIREQLCPTWLQLGNYFKIEFVPYGNAKVGNYLCPWKMKCIKVWLSLMHRQTNLKLVKYP